LSIGALLLGCSILSSCSPPASQVAEQPSKILIVLDTPGIVSSAEAYLNVVPQTVTAFPIERSAGGANDYYSEGRYWWPDPKNPEGPYIRKDGQSNPNLFTKHRDAVRDFTNLVSASTVAFLKTGQQKYADQAKAHILAWYVNPETRMNPSLNYAQAIKGINEGRGIGIIDTRSFIYVAKSIELLEAKGVFSQEEWSAVQSWFNAFGDWLTTSDFGLDERDNNNNHSTWWGAQLAAFARVADRTDLLDTARVQYRRQLAIQMDGQGIFTDEVGRTRPFHYTKYNLDAFAVLANLLSEEGEDIWTFKGPNGDFKKAVDWYLSYEGKLNQWPYPSELEPELFYHPAEYLLLLNQRYGEEDSAYAKTFVSAAKRHGPKSPERMAIFTWPDANGLKN